jgi:hypothetical protein
MAANKSKAAKETGGLHNMSARGSRLRVTKRSRKHAVLLILDRHKYEIIAALQSGKSTPHIKNFLDKKNIESGLKISNNAINSRLVDWGHKKKRKKKPGLADLDPYKL